MQHTSSEQQSRCGQDGEKRERARERERGRRKKKKKRETRRHGATHLLAQGLDSTPVNTSDGDAGRTEGRRGSGQEERVTIAMFHAASRRFEFDRLSSPAFHA